MSSCTARMNNHRFVDASSENNTSIPSPAPSVQFQSSAANTQSRIQKTQIQPQHLTNGADDHVKKRLVYDNFSNDSNGNFGMPKTTKAQASNKAFQSSTFTPVMNR